MIHSYDLNKMDKKYYMCITKEEINFNNACNDIKTYETCDYCVKCTNWKNCLMCGDCINYKTVLTYVIYRT